MATMALVSGLVTVLATNMATSTATSMVMDHITMADIAATIWDPTTTMGTTTWDPTLDPISVPTLDRPTLLTSIGGPTRDLGRISASFFGRWACRGPWTIPRPAGGADRCLDLSTTIVEISDSDSDLDPDTDTEMATRVDHLAVE